MSKIAFAPKTASGMAKKPAWLVGSGLSHRLGPD